MLISERYKFVFLAIPKTGTRSLYKALSNEPYVAKNIGDHKHIVPKKYEDYDKFTVVRNPYDRMFSLYWSCCVKSGDMKGFLSDMSQEGFEHSFKGFMSWVIKNKEKFQRINQSKYIILKTQAVFFNFNKIDYVINMDRLEEEVQELPFLSDPICLPHINSSKYSDSNKKEGFFDSEVIGMINEYCDEDFSILGFSKR